MAEQTIREQMAKALERIQRAQMAHHSGGDPAMIFDRFDAEAERKRKGWWSVDESAFEGLNALLDRHRAEPEGCLCCTHECGPECDCWNAGHQEGLEAQREPAGRGTA